MIKIGWNVTNWPKIQQTFVGDTQVNMILNKYPLGHVSYQDSFNKSMSTVHILSV